jgi:hypothetical protein
MDKRTNDNFILITIIVMIFSIFSFNINSDYLQSIFIPIFEENFKIIIPYWIILLYMRKKDDDFDYRKLKMLVLLIIIFGSGYGILEWFSKETLPFHPDFILRIWIHVAYSFVPCVIMIIFKSVNSMKHLHFKAFSYIIFSYLIHITHNVIIEIGYHQNYYHGGNIPAGMASRYVTTPIFCIVLTITYAILIFNNIRKK